MTFLSCWRTFTDEDSISRRRDEKYMAFRRTIVLFATASVFAGLLISVASAQQVPAPQTAVQLIGLTGVKDNAKGTPNVEKGNLRFTHGKARTDVSAASIQDVVSATSITVHCRFTSPDETLLLERDVNGKVRFFGGNLKATYDFAKKAAHAAHENFSSPDEK